MYGGAYGQYSAAVLPEGFPVIAFPDRSECEKSLSRDHHHMALTNLLGFDFPEACQQFAIADFVKPGTDANRVYWSPRAGIAFSTPDWCAATQGTTWREGLCGAVVVTPLR